ncbi:MAG TPA: hypothetical protein PLR20_05755 [Syntrophales bacterium]|nr:hypothetical protein [Syntrophales bacterium]HOX94496.1 hypothetical protein [Syntrophales bacterium]HPI57877.1 hypothetical protein [Syntrophales bacterium]HPN24535.1 hypothetical protein [Syntrophales bacterium]HQM28841.1 hypothetical protein [Syntrophales bacterium]
MTIDKPEPPSTLKEAGRKFWIAVLKEFEIRDAHDLARLERACLFLDDEDQAMKAIESDGMFIRNRYGGLVEHPGTKIIQQSRIGFLRAVREIAIDLGSIPESRPPGLYK